LALCTVFLPCRLCFEGVLVPGPRVVTEAIWNIFCAAALATGLTSSIHRFDRRRPSSRLGSRDPVASGVKCGPHG
jgi:hypothetical protein